MTRLSLQLLEGEFAVAQVQPTDPIPPSVLAADWFSITRTADELSIVAPASHVTGLSTCETGWAMMKLIGPFAFDLTGIVAGISDVIAKAEIGIFVLSTYDTDYVLVKSKHCEQAIDALTTAGYNVIRN